jgi:hypothetical protein
METENRDWDRPDKILGGISKEKREGGKRMNTIPLIMTMVVICLALFGSGYFVAEIFIKRSIRKTGRYECLGFNVIKGRLATLKEIRTKFEEDYE